MPGGNEKIYIYIFVKFFAEEGGQAKLRERLQAENPLLLDTRRDAPDARAKKTLRSAARTDRP